MRTSTRTAIRPGITSGATLGRTSERTPTGAAGRTPGATRWTARGRRVTAATTAGLTCLLAVSPAASAAPGATAPGTTAPGTAAATSAAPGATAPGTTAPGATAPGDGDLTAQAAPAAGLDVVLPVGVPHADPENTGWGGKVDVHLPDGRGRTFLRSDVPDVPPGSNIPGTTFGAAVAAGDLNGDGYGDVVIAAPGTRGGQEGGEVLLMFGSASGIGPAGALALPRPAGAGQQFGFALAMRQRSGGVTDLYVGAPDTTVAGKRDAGAVYWYAIDTRGRPRLVRTITGDSANLGGAAEAGDRFGEVLAPARDGVVVGIPHEDVGDRQDAGAVLRIRTNPAAGTLLASPILHQNSRGVPGGAETGDRFGAAVSPEGYVVGIPGEDLSGIHNAGAVQVFRSTRDGLTPDRMYHQNTPGIPGAAEDGDAFGSAVTAGVLDCQEQLSAAVGTPFEDLGKTRNPGSVVVFGILTPSGTTPCRARTLAQGSGLPGKAEFGDALGTALGLVRGDPDLDEDRFDTLLIGAPGEDGGAGGALTWSRGRARTFRSLTGVLQGERYGSVFPAQVDPLPARD